MSSHRRFILAAVVVRFVRGIVVAGTFFEGAITVGYASAAAEAAVQASIVAAEYGK